MGEGCNDPLVSDGIVETVSCAKFFQIRVVPRAIWAKLPLALATFGVRDPGNAFQLPPDQMVTCPPASCTKTIDATRSASRASASFKAPGFRARRS